MWDKLTLRIKITILTAFTLIIACACLTFISVSNAGNIFFYDEVPQESIPIDNDGNGIIGGNTSNTGDVSWQAHNKFKTQSVFYTIGIIILGTALSYFLAGKSLKPIKTLADRMEEIDENNLNEQIFFSPNGDEISRLTKSFNHMLEKLNKAFVHKKLFASNAAHELKTPLTNIMTNIEVMQMEEDPSINEYQEVIDITKENVERLTVLIQDLLYFNTEFDNDQCENIRADKLFEKILSDLSMSISEKNITVFYEGNINFSGERSLLERAFFNLVQNAVKYNKDNGAIKITSRSNTITIEDSGIGIPENSISHIFDPFYCVDKSRSRNLGGSGLGLSIVKQVFDKHNMTIHVSSELGKGTKIIVQV